MKMRYTYVQFLLAILNNATDDGKAELPQQILDKIPKNDPQAWPQSTGFLGSLESSATFHHFYCRKKFAQLTSSFATKRSEGFGIEFHFPNCFFFQTISYKSFRRSFNVFTLP